MRMSHRSHLQDQMGLKAIELRMLSLIFQKKKKNETAQEFLVVQSRKLPVLPNS